MAAMPLTLRVSVDADEAANELLQACSDISEIIELVPEWNKFECEQISDRIVKRFKHILQVAEKQHGR